jgi:ketosteroid isomerase-like protein
VSTNGLAASVEAMWKDFSAAGVDALVGYCHDDVEFAPHGAGERVLHGVDEVRAFCTEQAALGERREATIYEIEEFGDTVLMTGALRIVRRGQLTESQLAFVYRFRDGRLRSATSFASRAEALRAVTVTA